MATARNDMAETAMARANLYGLLAAVFRAEPDEAFLTQIKGPGFTGALSALGLSLGNDFEASRSDELVEDLAVEYTRLFIGPGPHLSPHESIHAEVDGDSGSFWGAKTVEVKKFIEATGLEYDASFPGMPDHISAEFEFMQRLAAKEAEAWTEPNEDFAADILKIERRFFDEHPSRWVPRFCDRIIKETDHSFYRGFAEVTKGFVAYENETLEAFATGAGDGKAGSD